MIPIEDDSRDSRGYYVAYSTFPDNIRLRVGSVDKNGVRRTVRNYGWVDYWTHATSLQNGLFFFYSSFNNGAIHIARLDANGSFQTLKSYTWINGITHFVHLGNGKVLAYSKSTGELHINQIDDDGNWSILRRTNIGAGWDELMDLGRQEEVRNGVCCYFLGQGFMAYNRDNNSLNIYAVKSNNSVQNRVTYNTTGWAFDVFAQLQGNKFIIHNRNKRETYIGGVSTTARWYWDKIYFTDTFYNQIFTMSFE